MGSPTRIDKTATVPPASQVQNSGCLTSLLSNIWQAARRLFCILSCGCLFKTKSTPPPPSQITSQQLPKVTPPPILSPKVPPTSSNKGTQPPPSQITSQQLPKVTLPPILPPKVPPTSSNKGTPPPPTPQLPDRTPLPRLTPKMALILKTPSLLKSLGQPPNTKQRSITEEVEGSHLREDIQKQEALILKALQENKLIEIASNDYFLERCLDLIPQIDLENACKIVHALTESRYSQDDIDTFANTAATNILQTELSGVRALTPLFNALGEEDPNSDVSQHYQDWMSQLITHFIGQKTEANFFNSTESLENSVDSTLTNVVNAIEQYAPGKTAEERRIAATPFLIELYLQVPLYTKALETFKLAYSPSAIQDNQSFQTAFKKMILALPSAREEYQNLRNLILDYFPCSSNENVILAIRTLSQVKEFDDIWALKKSLPPSFSQKKFDKTIESLDEK